MKVEDQRLYTLIGITVVTTIIGLLKWYFGG